MIHPEFGEHVSLVQPDDRRRFPLGRYATREKVSNWRVYKSKDGRQILLEAVIDE